MKITVISSSRRKGRVSTRIAHAIRDEIVRRGEEAEVLDLASLDLPPFTKRYAKLDSPDQKLTDTLKLLNNSDGLIFLTPEYNGSFSSSLKNFVDVFAKDPFKGKPIGVATGSTGRMGGIRAAYMVQQLILSIYGYPIPRMLTVGQMDKVIDEDGTVTDESFQEKLDGFLDGYLGFVKKLL